MQKSHQKMLFLLIVISILIGIITFLLKNQESKQQQSPLWMVQSTQQRKFHLTWRVEQPDQFSIELPDSSFSFTQVDGIWRNTVYPNTPVDQGMISDLLARLDQTLVTVIDAQESAGASLNEQLRLTLANKEAEQTLIIANATATQTAHYVYFTDDEQQIFLMDSTLVQLLQRGSSHYYNVNLPTFQINHIKKLTLSNPVNTFSIERNQQLNPEFISWYTLSSHPALLSIDGNRLQQHLLALWTARTPINVVNFYQPDVSPEQLKAYGLSPAQATIEVQHLDDSYFTLAIGFNADPHHFYAKTVATNDLWLLPSDLAQNLLELNAFDLISRPLTLIDINNLQSLTFLNHQSSHSLTLIKDTHRNSWAIRQKVDDRQPVIITIQNQQQIAALYEQVLLLHYDTPAFASNPQTTATDLAYTLRWTLTDDSIRHYDFYTTTSDGLQVVLVQEGLSIPMNLNINKYALEELWQQWEDMFVE